MFRKLISLLIIILLFLSACSSNVKEKGVKQSSNEMTFEEKIVSAIVKAVNKTTNTNKDRIIDVQVNDNLGTELENDKIVLARLNASDNFSIRKGTLLNSKKVFQELFEVPEVTEVTLFWYFTLVDKYGNEKDDVILKVSVTCDTASKINWDNFDFNNLPDIAEQYWEHPALKK